MVCYLKYCDEFENKVIDRHVLWPKIRKHESLVRFKNILRVHFALYHGSEF